MLPGLHVKRRVSGARMSHCSCTRPVMLEGTGQRSTHQSTGSGVAMSDVVVLSGEAAVVVVGGGVEVAMVVRLALVPEDVVRAVVEEVTFMTTVVVVASGIVQLVQRLQLPSGYHTQLLSHVMLKAVRFGSHAGKPWPMDDGGRSAAWSMTKETTKEPGHVVHKVLDAWGCDLDLELREPRDAWPQDINTVDRLLSANTVQCARRHAHSEVRILRSRANSSLPCTGSTGCPPCPAP